MRSDFEWKVSELLIKIASQVFACVDLNLPV